MNPRLIMLTLLVAAVFSSWTASAQQFAVAADTVDSRLDMPTAPLLWQQPLYASATSVLFLAGTAPLFVDQAHHVNMFVREEVQLFRRSWFDNRRFTFDNYIQYIPLASNLVLCAAGVPSRHNFFQQSCRVATSFLLSSAIVYPIKESVSRMRPDRNSDNSFPSGHTATAFLGAELLRLEYGCSYPWIPVAGYTVAAFTGFMRIYNDRHWTSDVFAGAAIGIISANVSYWVNDLIDNAFSKRKTSRVIRSL